MNENYEVICNVYQCHRVGNGFDQNQKYIKIEGMQCKESYVDHMNAQTQNHGLYFVIDKDATKELVEKKKAKAEADRRKAAATKAMNKDILTDIIKGAISAPQEEEKTTKPKKEKE